MRKTPFFTDNIFTATAITGQLMELVIVVTMLGENVFDTCNVWIFKPATY